MTRDLIVTMILRMVHSQIIVKNPTLSNMSHNLNYQEIDFNWQKSSNSICKENLESEIPASNDNNKSLL